MTESEAIKILQRDLQIQLENKALPDGIEAIQIAIQALEKQEKIKEIIANAISVRPIMPNTMRAVYTTVVKSVILHHSLTLIFKVFSISLKLSCTSATCA